MRFRLITMLGLAAATGCASKNQPDAAPAPADAAPANAAPAQIISLDVPEDIFVGMGVAAIGWAKGYLSPRSVGIYQAEDASPQFRRMVQAATTRYAVRPIQSSDFAVVCSGSDRSRSAITSPATRCTMKYVDAVVAFNSVRRGRDSGYVGMSITRVPPGANRSERIYYCITLARKDTAWAFKRNERVVDPQRCFRNVP